MAKYHINRTGNATPCKAQRNNCPFGDSEKDHYATAAEARKAYEEKQENLPTPKNYAKYTPQESAAIASTIKKQINLRTYMSLGASDFTAIPGGLRFTTRILPFTTAGVRSTRPAPMLVEVKLNGHDLYDVKVHHVKKFKAETHFEAENVGAEELSRTLLSLDYDGPTTENPRYM